MTTLRKEGARLAALLAAAALFGCAKGEQASQRADSTARNLTLAPAETTAAMRDVPAPEPARPAPERKASVPASKPVVKPAAPATPTTPSTLTLAAGTKLSLSVSDTISTRSAKPGDGFTATVSEDVRDASGRVVIPAGSSVSGTIVAADPAPNPRSPGRLELDVRTVTVRGTGYPVEATVESKDSVMQGRGVTGGDAAKVGGGAAAGAIVGKIIGGNRKGAVIGGLAGAAAGAAAARASRDIDVVLPKGAGITIKLTKPLAVKRAT
ncbi:MAG TPA: hypothetical protein VIW28_02000 [Gemmatimonadales bacterium]